MSEFIYEAVFSGDDCLCEEPMIDCECLSCGNEFSVDEGLHDDESIYMECDCGEHMTTKIKVSEITGLDEECVKGKVG